MDVNQEPEWDEGQPEFLDEKTREYLDPGG